MNYKLTAAVYLEDKKVLQQRTTESLVKQQMGTTIDRLLKDRLLLQGCTNYHILASKYKFKSLDNLYFVCAF